MHDNARVCKAHAVKGRSWEGKARTWVETEVVAGAGAADGADSLVQRYNAAVLLLEATQTQVPLPYILRKPNLVEPQGAFLTIM